MTTLDERTEPAALIAPPGPRPAEAPPIAPGPPDRPRPVSARTADDWFALGGSLAASLCLAWLLFTQALPFTGKIGFVLFWFVLFVATYACITALSQPLPIVRDRVASALVQGGAAVVGLALASTLVYTFVRGWPAYRHLNFFTHDMSATGPLQPLTQGGILHALVGSAIELVISVLISMPLGLLAAVYMVEIGGRFARVVRTVVEAMTALPDLVAGLFVYAFVLVALGFSRTGLAAGLALAITMLPIIARSSEVVLRVVPGGLREASLALGASQWRTVWSVVLPTARPGLATALILGMARGVGETAPVYIVSSASAYLNYNPFSEPMNSLPLFAFTGVRAPDPNSITRGYGAASVLLAFVAVLFVVVRLLARQRRGRA